MQGKKGKPFLRMEYFRTYYFTNICDSIIENPFPYVRTLNDFWGEGKFEWFLKPFQKYSALHAYIDFCIDRIIYEANESMEDLSLNELKKEKFWIHQAMDFHKINYVSFEEWLKTNMNTKFTDDLFYAYLHHLEITDAYQSLKNQMVEETFYVLFLNRKFLSKFNHEMSGIFQIQDTEDYEEWTSSRQ